jgi:hypothetical protein
MPIQLFAQPWWVNLLIVIPFSAVLLRRKGLHLSWRQLGAATLFAAAFGFVEAAVVVYLRAAIGLLPGFRGTLHDVIGSAKQFYELAPSAQLPQSLLAVELIRESATMLMLIAVAVLSAPRVRERWAMFLWNFAIWDLTYYVFLFATIRWPGSLRDLDILFLIPSPWISQVWFPCLVSGLTILAIALSRKPRQLATERA